MDAIRTLKQIESENRLATPEEQKVLSKFVGWGGLSQAFDENNAGWSKEYAELKAPYFLTRREMGIFNVGGPGVVRAGDAVFEMDYKEALSTWVRATVKLLLRARMRLIRPSSILIP